MPAGRRTLFAPGRSAPIRLSAFRRCRASLQMISRILLT